MAAFTTGTQYPNTRFQMLLFRLLMLYHGAVSHFTLIYPPTIGFDNDLETSAPCGGFNPSASSTVANFGASGDSVQVNLAHPQAAWLFRLITLDGLRNNGTWLQLNHIIEQNGLGQICLTLSVPGAWIGSTAVFGAVADAPDGVLYQCSVVKISSDPIINGSPSCSNSTGVVVGFTGPDDKLAGEASSSVAPFTASSSSSSSRTTTTSSQSTGSPTGPSTPPASSGEAQMGSSGLPLGAKIGLGVGLGLGGLVILAVLAFLFMRRARRAPPVAPTYSGKPELEGVPSQRQELDGRGLVELDGTAFPGEPQPHHLSRGHTELEGSMPVIGHYDPAPVLPATTEQQDTYYHTPEPAPSSGYSHIQAHPQEAERANFSSGASVMPNSTPQPDWSTNSTAQAPPVLSAVSSQASSSRGRDAQIAELLVRQEQLRSEGERLRRLQIIEEEERRIQEDIDRLRSGGRKMT